MAKQQGTTREIRDLLRPRSTPFPMTRHQMKERKKKKVNWRTIVRNTTDNVDQDQTILPVNLVDIVCQTYNFKLAVFRF